MSVLEVNDVWLNVQDLGKGSPVVLVAGFGLTGQLWDRQVRVLTRAGHRVVTVDQRGHGGSEKPLDGYHVEQLAEDLAGVVAKLGITGATLVGHSFGGQVAFRVAAQHPTLVGGLVLVGSNGVRASRSERFPFGRPPEPTIAALVAQEERDRLAARRSTLASAFGSEPDRDVLKWLLRCSLEMPSWAAVACYRSMLESDLLGDLPLVTQPVLQIVGNDDPVHSVKGARWLTEHLAHARLVEIPGCGHYPMIEAADAFDEELLAVASEVSGRASSGPERAVHGDGPRATDR